MKPFYENEHGKLFCGDCLEILPSIGKVDLVLTDPPYGISYQSNHRAIKHDKIINDECLDFLPYFFEKISLNLKDNTHCYFFAPYQKIETFIIELKKHIALKNIIIWEKNNTGMGDLDGDYAPKYEPILFCSNGKRKLNGGRDPNILKFAKTDNKYHPTQKPEDLLKFLVGKSTNENETILDPFSGSGSTALAVQEIGEGRKWIGIEKEEKYCEIAAKRIEQESRQMKLF